MLAKRFLYIGEGFPRIYWYLWWGTLLNRLGTFVMPFFALYLTLERHISISAATLIIALSGIGSFVASLLGGTLSDTLGRRRTLILALMLAASSTMILGLIQNSLVIAAVAFFWGICTDLYRPAVAAIESAPASSPKSTGAGRSLSFYGDRLWL